MLERAYRLHIDRIRQNASKTAYRDAMAGIINIAYIWNYVKGYEEGLTWTERMGDLVKEYKELYSEDKDYIDKQWARYKIFSATSLEGVGRHRTEGSRLLLLVHQRRRAGDTAPQQPLPAGVRPRAGARHSLRAISDS